MFPPRPQAVLVVVHGNINIRLRNHSKIRGDKNMDTLLLFEIQQALPSFSIVPLGPMDRLGWKRGSQMILKDASSAEHRGK